MPSDGASTSADGSQFSSLPTSLGKVDSEELYLAMDHNLISFYCFESHMSHLVQWYLSVSPENGNQLF